MIVHSQYPLGETRVQREAGALVDAGFQVEVICLREEAEAFTEVVDRVRVHRMPVRRHRGSTMWAQLLEYLAFLILAGLFVGWRHLRRRFDVVQVHNLPDALVFAAVIPKMMGAKVILDLHDLMPEFYAARVGSSMTGSMVRVVRLQERVSCAFADLVITVTDRWRQTLADRGVPKEKSAVVMNLADPAVFVRSTRYEHDDGFTVIYHGTFTERYGVDLLVEAARRLVGRVQGLRVDLLGEGEQRARLVDLVAEFRLEDVVRISPTMISAEELPPIISRADVGVVPNRSNVFTEGILPTKLLEYVAMGTPVVASRTSGVTEYFDDSMVCFFAPGNADDLADRLLFLANHPEERSRLAGEADRFNLEHSWEKTALDYVSLVSSLAGPGREKH